MTSKRLARQLDGGGVELANDVVLRGDDVEVEPPVDVVMVYLANARVSIAENPKRGWMVPSSCIRHLLTYRYQPACSSLPT